MEAPKCWRCGSRNWHYAKSTKFVRKYSARCAQCAVPEGLIPVTMDAPTQRELWEAHAQFLATFSVTS